MDPEAIAGNILRAKRDYGISYLFFTDSVFNISPEYNVRLAETLIRRRTDIRWGAYFSPRGIDAEQMRLFRASGLTHIEFGTESFCDRTLEAYGKHFTFGDVVRASRLALDEGVYYAHFLILGGYGDTRENVRETIENSRRMEYTVMFPYAGMRIYPHTRLAELAGEGALTTPVFWQAEKRGRDRADKPEYKVKLSAACCFSNKVQVIEHYHNSSWLEHGGAPEKATKSAFVSAVDKYLRDQNKYQKNESKITWQDIEDCLIFVSNNFSTQTSYENQTKKSITNKFVQEAMTEFLRTNLEIYFIENHFDAEKIAEQVLVNKRSRESAEKQRLNIKKKLSGNIDISNRVQKFVDCRSKDVEKREIYIVEGDSALGSVKLSRDAEYQGIMPVRGKILNCLKADYARIFKSEIITDLIRVLGCGVEIQNKHVKDLAAFDLNNLRWNKVVICTDGDVDGFQIRTLILTMLYRLTPTLIQQGYVYIAETPLFEINCGDKTWFAYSDKEKADIVKSLEGKKYKIDRSKGLGENDPDMMWLTTMNPETRRLIRVMPEDVERTAEVFDLLLGDNLQGRKDHIAENGARFLDLADIS